MWADLVPLILGSALVPIQIVITIMLLSTPKRALTAAALVAGMMSVRLVQGVVFGLILSSGDDGETSSDGNGWIVSTVLLIVAVLFYVTAAKQLVHEDDPDAPPPKWMTMVTAMTPVKSFLLGAGLLAIGPKFWVFTLGAIGAIGDANLGRTDSIITFVVFVVLASSLQIVIVLTAALAPRQSATLLDGSLRWLQSHNRQLLIGLGAVFGTWFLVKSLSGFGVL